MRYILVIVGLYALITSCENHKSTNNTISEQYTIPNDTFIPDIIKNFPIGILVEQVPETIYAEIFEKDSTKYIWRHQTTVKALFSDVKIIEFGTYNYKDSSWELGTLTQKPYTAKDFEQWYFINQDGIMSWDNCKNGILKKGVLYCDPANYSIKNAELVERNGLWYYKGVDENSDTVIGYGRYKTLPILKKEE